MIRLDKRLNAILNCIPSNSRIIDIGSDHGKIPVAALIKGVTLRAIATDISPKSLIKTVKLAEKYGVSDRIETRCGDGLEVIGENEGDTLIIAGMGANEIIKILDSSHLRFNTYIFTPHQKAVRLRKYLSASGYIIVSDNKIKSLDKYYDIIVAKRGTEILSYRELMLGKSERGNADFNEFLLFEREKILNKLKGSKSIAYMAELKKYLELIDGVIDENK